MIDVLDLKGAIVMDVDAGQAAAEAGLAPGDLVEQLDGQAVESALDLESKLGSRPARPAGQPGRPDARPARPGRCQSSSDGCRRWSTSSDRFQPANVTVAALRALMATTTDPALQPIVRLNLAAALLRAGDSAEALALLKDTTLPAGPGVSAGTVLYLLGEAALAQGDQASARRPGSRPARPRAD